MKKIISWITDNILFVLTLFLLIFIPLYPKIPLLDVRNTWVYIRVEDFIVLFALLFWLALLFKKKITPKTPITMPIIFFWIVGALATLNGVVLVFPTLANVFPNVAFLAYLRHLEYMSVFFIAYSAIDDKKKLNSVIAVILGTFLLVFLYGIGQKYAHLPAYLTMNEEFAKGIPIQLSELSRVPSTFAGHYDLAAYLVLILPIFASLIFGFRNWIIKLALGACVLLGITLIFMTVSRVSLVVLLIALFVVILFQKRRLVVFFIPGIILLAFVALIFKPTILNRFGNTLKSVDVLVDAKTGESIGNVKYVSSHYFDKKAIEQTRVNDLGELVGAITGSQLTPLEEEREATNSAIKKPLKLPPEAPLVTAANISTGENLPQGTGYINLSLSPVNRRLGSFFYELSPNSKAATSAAVLIIHGNFLVKRAAAYDLSFTTRFQGEWPHALSIFAKNILLGGGYGSVSLAVDNNYFRMLGEVGLAGVATFFAIFLAIGIYITKILPNVESKLVRSFVIGFVAGVIGLALNATLIDVFEASKIAFLLWLLTGVTIGILKLYQEKPFHIYRELRQAATSPYAIVVYLLIGTIVIFSPMIGNFFVGDDFTWFRWAADCGKTVCHIAPGRILSYFTDSGGFFFRPGTKIYFYFMYSIFWLNQVVYHVVSIALHFVFVTLFFFLAKKILKSVQLAALASFLILVMSGYAEVVFWIAATGYLFNAIFILASLLFFISWEENKKPFYYIGALVCISFSLLFHELGVVAPFLLLAYHSIYGNDRLKKTLIKPAHFLLFAPIIFYLILRFAAGSHWFSGDYSYDLLRLPFNFGGNIIGYAMVVLFGPMSLSFYEILRNALKVHILLAGIATTILLYVLYVLGKLVLKTFSPEEKRIIYFSLSFFIISLLPFLGLGNITSRYSYLAGPGLVILLAFALRKLYWHLISYGKDIAVGALTTVILVFSLFHVIQVQQIHGDWHTAGLASHKFFISIDELYTNDWGKETVKLHFVNVPIKTGEAWIFPVGLPDALWITFRNDNLKVYQEPTLQAALSNAGDSIHDRVFEFQSDGSVKEVIRFKNGFPINVLVQ